MRTINGKQMMARRRAWPAPTLLVLFALQAALMIGAGPAHAAPEPSGLPLPRFVTLRSDDANMRTGPGEQYPIKWTYQRAGLPVEIVAEYHTWRRVRDWQGTEGWMHAAMLSGHRSFIVVGETRTMRASADASSRVVAQVEPKVTGLLDECPAGGAWCRVKVEGLKGWLKRTDIWGVYPGETVE
ncbi:MAG: SH3 domain-containing protein [Rhodospirillales bacterium]